LTSLHEAAKRGKVSIVEFFVSNGANISLKDNDGRTPLDAARELNHTKVAEYFMNAGAE